MKALLKSAAAGALAQLGVARALHRALHPDRLTIVMYHAVVPAPLKVPDWCFLDASSFRRQVEYLARHFDVLRLSEAVERMREGRLRRPTAVLSFDDGFQNNRDVAWSLLRSLGLPATMFLTTGLVGTEDTVWYCRLNRALAETRRPALVWSGERFDLSGAAAKAEASRAIQGRLKVFAHPRLVGELATILGELGEEPGRPVAADSPYRMLSREAVAEMSASGLVEFGGHTHTHAILSRLRPEERALEIDRSLATVQDLTGAPCRLFSYPNGRPQDYDADTVGALHERGIRAAVTTVAGPNDQTTPVLELRRYGVGAGLQMARFQLMVHHAAE